MTTKFLITSLLGVSSLGGAVAGGIYLSRDNASSKTEKSPKVSSTESTPNTQEPAPAKPDAPETVPQSKVTAAPAGKGPSATATETRQDPQLEGVAQRDGATAEVQRLTQ